MTSPAVYTRSEGLEERPAQQNSSVLGGGSFACYLTYSSAADLAACMRGALWGRRRVRSFDSGCLLVPWVRWAVDGYGIMIHGNIKRTDWSRAVAANPCVPSCIRRLGLGAVMIRLDLIPVFISGGMRSAE